MPPTTTTKTTDYSKDDIPYAQPIEVDTYYSTESPNPSQAAKQTKPSTLRTGLMNKPKADARIEKPQNTTVTGTNPNPNPLNSQNFPKFTNTIKAKENASEITYTIELNHSLQPQQQQARGQAVEINEDWLFTGRLLRVKGTNLSNMELKEVKPIKSSMNSGDCFLLDTVLNVYLWIGTEANSAEQAKALSFAQSIVAHRKQHTQLVLLHQNTPEERNCKQFWDKIQTETTCLGFKIKEHQFRTLDRVKSDFKVAPFRKKLYKLSDNDSTELKFTFVSRAKAKHKNNINESLLQSNDVYILDDGFKIWVWQGKHASEREKANAMTYAVKYVKKFNRPTSLPVEKVLEGQEPADFRDSFGHYRDTNCSIV